VSLCVTGVPATPSARGEIGRGASTSTEHVVTRLSARAASVKVDSVGRFALWLTVRSTIAHRRAAAFVLAALFGVVGGVATAAFWGADRVETAYERLVRDVDAPDLVFLCDEPCVGPGSTSERILAEPSVEDVTVVIQQFVAIRTSGGAYLGLEATDECATGAGEIDLTWAEWPRSGRPPARLVSGRLPDPTSTTELALSAITARRSGIEVGDSVFLTGGCGDTFGDPGVATRLDPPAELEVVGILVGFLDVRPPGQFEFFENVYVSEALIRQTGFASDQGVAAWLTPGSGVADLSADAANAVVFVRADHEHDIGEELTADAAALRLFGLAAILSAIAVLGQLLWAWVRSAVSMNRVLVPIGARRRDLSALGFVHGAVIATSAAMCACVVAVVAAPLVPTGAADPIDEGTDVGLAVDVGLLAGVATLLVVLALSIVPAIAAARPRERVTPRRAPRWPSRFAEAFQLAPAASLGTRFALEPEGDPQPAPIRSGIGAIVVALAVVTGVITFAAGLEHLRTTPRLVGWNWDFFLFADGDDAADLAQTIAQRSDVEASGAGTIFVFGISLVDDFGEFRSTPNFMAFDSAAHGIGPVVLEGRAPEGPDEVLLSPGLASEHGLDVGDVTTLYAAGQLAGIASELGVPIDALDVEADVEAVVERSFEVVGIGVIPVLDGRLDAGASLTLDGYARALQPPGRADLLRVFELAPPGILLDLLLSDFGPVELTPSERARLFDAGPDGTATVLASWSDEQFARLTPEAEAGPDVVFVDVDDGLTPQAVLQRFADDGLTDQEFVDSVFDEGNDALRPERLVRLDLGDVAWIPSVFGQLMGLTAVSALAYVVTSAARARRRALATLRALGLSSSQTRRTIAWQSVVTVGVSMAIALPLGVIGGRFAWNRYATGLDVVPEPVTPWWHLAILVLVTIATALLVSIVPGRRAARRSPVESLRSE